MIGSQWWSVRRDTYQQAMELKTNNRRIDTYFKKIECSDESYFATIFNAVSANLKRHGTTYVKWVGRGKIQDLDRELIREAQGDPDFFFARKLNLVTLNEMSLK